MSILSGYDAVKLHKVDDNGDYKRVSPWVSADTVELPENEPLTNYVNRGAYIDDWDEEVDPVKEVVINDNRTATDEVWSSKKTSDMINAVTNTTYTLTGEDATLTLTPSTGDIQEVTVNNVANAVSATTASQLSSGNVGNSYQPVYFNNGVPSAAKFEVQYGALAYNSTMDSIYDFDGRCGTVIMSRADTSATPTYAIFDQWGGITYITKNNDMDVSVEQHFEEIGVSTIRLTNHTNAALNYIITNCKP